jgi:hypothetical protein
MNAASKKNALMKKNLEKAEKRLLAEKVARKGFDAKKFSGKLKGVFGDPLRYQKSLRREW